MATLSVLDKRKLANGLAAVQKENKSCFNCGALANYAVFPVGITVCTNCSGAHRDVGHKVKGFSTSRFVLQDVELLKKYGNKVVGEIYLDSWTGHEGTFERPRPGDMPMVKYWIQVVFQNKRFFSESKLQAVESADGSITPATASAGSAPFSLPAPGGLHTTSRAVSAASSAIPHPPGADASSPTASTSKTLALATAASGASQATSPSPGAAAPEAGKGSPAPAHDSAADPAPAPALGGPAGGAGDLLGGLAGASPTLADSSPQNDLSDPFSQGRAPAPAPAVPAAFEPFGTPPESAQESIFDPFGGNLGTIATHRADAPVRATFAQPAGQQGGAAGGTTPAAGFHPFAGGSSMGTGPSPAFATISPVPSEMLSVLAPGTPHATDARFTMSASPSANLSTPPPFRSSPLAPSTPAKGGLPGTPRAPLEASNGSASAVFDPFASDSDTAVAALPSSLPVTLEPVAESEGATAPLHEAAAASTELAPARCAGLKAEGASPTAGGRAGADGGSPSAAPASKPGVRAALDAELFAAPAATPSPSAPSPGQGAPSSGAATPSVPGSLPSPAAPSGFSSPQAAQRPQADAWQGFAPPFPSAAAPGPIPSAAAPVPFQHPVPQPPQGAPQGQPPSQAGPYQQPPPPAGYGGGGWAYPGAGYAPPPYGGYGPPPPPHYGGGFPPQGAPPYYSYGAPGVPYGAFPPPAYYSHPQAPQQAVFYGGGHPQYAVAPGAAPPAPSGASNGASPSWAPSPSGASAGAGAAAPNGAHVPQGGPSYGGPPYPGAPQLPAGWSPPTPGHDASGVSAPNGAAEQPPDAFADLFESGLKVSGKAPAPAAALANGNPFG